MSDEENFTVEGKTKAELLAEARLHFDMVQKIRMLGPFRNQDGLAALLEIPANRLSIEKLEKIGLVCKRADISRGVAYVDRGLVYGCIIHWTEVGYRVGYKYLCKNKEERDGDEMVR
jgi:hypothetical protein